jgi:transposase
VNDEASTTEQRLRALEVKLAQFVADSTEQLAKAQSERDEYRKLNLLLREENERLKRGLLGQKAERLPRNDAQLSLAIMSMAMTSAQAKPDATSPPEDTQLVPEHTRRKPKRRTPSDDLPRVPFYVIPPEVEREGLNAFELIGADKRSVIERRPSSTVIVEVIYNKYVRKSDKSAIAKHDKPDSDTSNCKVFVGETLELPIERGNAGPGLLADTIVRRWQDHQPLNRLEGIYGREGLELARSTICTWHSTLAELCKPLVDAMFADALTAPFLCVDATGVLVQAKEKCRVGHFWVMVVPERHILYRYSRDHDGKAVDKLLPGYSGYLVADAHSVYEHLYREGPIIEVACWAHSRRYAFKALASDPERAKFMLTHIGALFAVERTIAKCAPAKRRHVRQEKSKPIVEAFFRWCDQEAERVLDESPISKAIGYARNQRKALERFLDDGRLPLHNNASELNLRRQVLGRRNWLFLGNDDGGHTNTIFVSLLASCRIHNIEPLGYIRDLLCLLPRWPRSKLLDLAPVNWNKTAQHHQTQELLDANIFRRAALGLPLLRDHRPKELPQQEASHQNA